MAKPLQGREMSAVTTSLSVSCLPVSGSAAEQVGLETRLKQLRRLKIPDLFWQPVPCQRCSHGERTFSQKLSQSGQRRGHRAWTIVVCVSATDRGHRLTKSTRYWVQDQIKKVMICTFCKFDKKLC